MKHDDVGLVIYVAVSVVTCLILREVLNRLNELESHEHHAGNLVIDLRSRVN